MTFFEANAQWIVHRHQPRLLRAIRSFAGWYVISIHGYVVLPQP